MSQQSSGFFSQRAGMTLFEALVGIAIIVTFSAVVLVRQSTIRGETFITNIAYDAALTIREAQAFGIGVRGTEGLGFEIPYGVHFDQATPSSFFIFADVNKNNQWNSSGDQLIKKFALTEGVRISSFCAVGTPQSNCTNSADFSWRINTLDIFYIRPSPDARIFSDCSSQCTVPRSATITLTSPTGVVRTIAVTTTGQINLQ